jgi:hypothetical protein
VARAGRYAAQKGGDQPDEVLRTMPARKRERILKDRERLAAGIEAKSKPPAAGPPGDRELDHTIDALFDSLAHPPVTAVTVNKTAPPPPQRKYPPGMDESKMQDLYQRYVRARKTVGEAATPELRYEQLVSTVLKQGPKIIEQHAAREVDFQVVIKEGKVILKATPKK